MVIGAGTGWQSTVPAAGARLTVASVDGSDPIASVTAPTSGVPLETGPALGASSVSDATERVNESEKVEFEIY
jgi:protein-L-isoaspartate O-methyltransferase